MREENLLAANSTPLLDETIEFPPADGPYRETYKTTLSVGKGAFGFVKLAQRRSDCKEVCIVYAHSNILKLSRALLTHLQY